MDLSTVLTPVPVVPGRFAFDVPDGLQQGRGAWGGVATGATVSAAEQSSPRPGFEVRTISAQLVAPLLVGAHRIDVEVVRLGAGTTTLAARLCDSGGALVAHAVVVLGAPRAVDALPGGAHLDPPPSLADGPEAVAAIPLGPPVAPRFLEQMEVRPVAGLPFTGTGETVGWIRPAAPVSRVGAPIAVAMADAWWVTAMSLADGPRPVGTLGFTADLTADPASLPREPDGRLRPLLHRGRTLAVRDGYIVESRELWTCDGRLATYNTQTVAVIK
jgi:hypothetical protein